MKALQEVLEWVLMSIRVLCACYVFFGIVPVILACTTGNWILIVLALAAYAGNIWLLRYANEKDW